MIKNIYTLAKTVKSLKEFQQLTDQQSKDRLKVRLFELAGNSKGLIAKVLQLHDVVTKEQSLGFEREALNPMDYKFFIYSLAKSFKQPLENIFSFIDEKPYTASLSQVHRGVLLDGTEVAIKLKYPGIDKIIDEQLKILNLLPKLVRFSPVQKWGFPLEAYKRYFVTTIIQELDYKSEASNLRRLAMNNRIRADVQVPDLYDEYLNSDCLVMSWHRGESLESFAKKITPAQKKELAESLVGIFLENILIHGFFQGDPNRGNFLFELDPAGRARVVLLDGGYCQDFDVRFTTALCTLCDSVINHDERSIDWLSLFVDLGFDKQKIIHVQELLAPLAVIIVGPFASLQDFHIREWKLKEKVNDLLGEKKWWFRAAGGVQFFSFMKSFLFVLDSLNQLDVSFSGNAILRNILRLASDQQLIDRERYSGGQTLDAVINCEASAIKIRVLESNVVKVDLSLPASAVVNLKDLMGPELVEKLEHQGYNVTEIIENLITRGVPKGPLFALQGEQKEVFIDLV